MTTALNVTSKMNPNGKCGAPGSLPMGSLRRGSSRMCSSRRASMVAAAMLAALVAGCATQPVGPSVMALPGSSKSFDQFRFDDAECRGYATSQVGGGTANDAAVDAGVKSAAIGTAVGAIAGAAIGGHGGAGVGAGTGLIVGSVAGAGAGDTSSRGLQRRYDNAYVQCMYAKGERVPVSSSMESGRRAARSAPPAYASPPPPNYPPPNYPPPNYPPPPR